MIRIAIIDDHRMLRESLRAAFAREPDLQIVGDAATGADALRLVAKLKPDVVLLDIRLPDMSGIDVARELHARHPSVKVIAVTAHDDKQFVREMLKSGAAGYVSKAASTTHLTAAIRAVAEGQSYFSPDIARVLASDYAATNPTATPPSSCLTPRERQVLHLLADGARSPAIANELHVTTGTVEMFRRNIMHKLNLHTIAELTKYALREGLTKL